MPKPIKDIVEVPFAACPLCASERLIVVTGKRGLFGKKADTVQCQDCTAILKVSSDKALVNLDNVPSPYAFFQENFEKWREIDGVARLSELIRTNSFEALQYLSGASRHAWHIRLILGATGAATTSQLELKREWDDPETKDDAKRQLAQIRQMQKEIRQVKREMAQDMKEIRVKYGRKKEMQRAKAAALEPYEQTKLIADNVLVRLDRIKLEIQTWIDEQKKAA